MNGLTDAQLYGMQAVLDVWTSDQGRDERLAFHLRIDPRCLVIEARQGRPTRPHVRHVDDCSCGAAHERQTLI